MNNLKSLSIVLLLSLGVVGFNYAKSGCSSDCSTGSGTSSDCNSCSTDSSCDSSCSSNNPSTFFRPRPTTTNLTYRNDLTFYQRYHDARCNFFTWDTTYIGQQSRKGECLGVGFFGANPITIGENNSFNESTPTDINSINLGLGITQPNGATANSEFFNATISIKPQRRVFAWLSQLIFNLDCVCTGLWADLSFAVVNARHKLHFKEEGNEGDVSTEPTTVAEAFSELNVFADECHKTGVDDVLFRVGYDYSYCSNDHIGIYFLGIAPTGKHYDNARWFQPLIGSRHGAVGVGLTGDYTIWVDEVCNTDFVFQTELMYQFRLHHKENRVFDLKNGTNSRFLLAAESTTTNNPVNIVDLLTQCVKVEPRHQIEWWANFHYQWCNWGAELSYNLWWRDCERICPTNIDFGDFGIFDMSGAVCTTPQSNSKATIGSPTAVTGTTGDATFVPLTSSDVDFGSAAARRVLSHTFGAAVSYNNVWCDCYPWYAGLGAGYEYVSSKYRRHALEGWNVYAKLAMSF